MIKGFESIEDLIYKPISGEWGDDVGEINVLRTTNFNNDGTLNLSEVVKRSIDLSKVEKKKLKYGDTIIEKSGGSPSQPVGRVVYFNIKDETFLCNNFTSVIRPKENLDPRYLFWYLYSNHLNQNTRKYQNKTTGIINLQLERYIKELQIPLPPLPIQKRIAEILDAADALKRKDQELLKKYDELAQAIFIDMFGDPVKNEKGWEVKYLDEVSNKITDGEHGTVERLAEGKPYLMARNIRDGFIDFTEIDYISEKDHNKIFKRCNPQNGDLLLVCVGATIGRVCLMNSDEKYSLARSVALIKPNRNQVSSLFLFALFKTDFMQRQIKAANNSSAQAGLYTGRIKELKIYLPPIELQNAFAKRIEKLLNQVKIVDVKKTENLFNSLIQKAFKGELVV